MAEYPVIPHRPNFTDVRTQQVYDPKCTVFTNTVLGGSYAQLHADGGTLESGVLIRQVVGGKNTLITTAGLSADANAGYQLQNGEEVFIPIRQLGDVYVRRTGTGSSPKITYYAR